MKRVKELLMRQMELLSMVAEEQVERYEDPDIEGTARAMAAVAEEIRRIIAEANGAAGDQLDGRDARR